MKKYMYKGMSYTTFSQIRKLFPNVSFAETITPEALAPLGITTIEEQEPMYVPTTDEIVAALVDAVQVHLDTTAQQRGYDNIASLASYENSDDAIFRKEGLAGRKWRDSVWRTCFSIKDDVLAKKRTAPTAEQLISELPVFTWGE